jgi:hypothetical protein
MDFAVREVTEDLVGVDAIVLILDRNALSTLGMDMPSQVMVEYQGDVLLAVAAGSSLFGIVGAFLAVPTAAVAAVLLRYVNEQIDKKSAPPGPELDDGPPADDADADAPQGDPA